MNHQIVEGMQSIAEGDQPYISSLIFPQFPILMKSKYPITSHKLERQNHGKKTTTKKTQTKTIHKYRAQKTKKEKHEPQLNKKQPGTKSTPHGLTYAINTRLTDF